MWELLFSYSLCKKLSHRKKVQQNDFWWESHFKPKLQWNLPLNIPFKVYLQSFAANSFVKPGEIRRRHFHCEKDEVCTSQGLQVGLFAKWNHNSLASCMHLRCMYYCWVFESLFICTSNMWIIMLLYFTAALPTLLSTIISWKHLVYSDNNLTGCNGTFLLGTMFVYK